MIMLFKAWYTAAIFMWQLFLLLHLDEENLPILCDGYICRKAGVLALMWQIKVITYEKLLM